MSLPEWEVSLISAIAGAAMGAIIPYVFVVRQENERKKRTRRVLIAELSLAKEALKEALIKGPNLGAGIVAINSDLPIYKSFPVDISNYKGIDFESLVKSVDINVLNSVQKTYRIIDKYNEKMTRDADKRAQRTGHDVDNFLVDESESKEVIQQIEKTVKEMKLRYADTK